MWNSDTFYGFVLLKTLTGENPVEEPKLVDDSMRIKLFLLCQLMSLVFDN